MTPPYPPYAADTRAKGWRFELDYERIRQSDTWALAAPEHRPWLLMLWMVAWEQTPCGSLPDDDTLIAARIDMAPKAFAKARETLRRGWWLAEDGRLYHHAITQHVLRMIDKRAKEAARKAGTRQGTPATVPRDNTGTDDTRTSITRTIEKKETPSPLAPRFDAFWKAYPKKVAKDAARKAFDKRKPDDELTARMVKAIEAQSRGEAWRKNGGEFIPNPATWLNAGQWQDEGVTLASVPAPPTRSAWIAAQDEHKRQVEAERLARKAREAA